MQGLGVCIVVPLAFVVFFVAWVCVGFCFMPKRAWLDVTSSVPAFLVFLLCSAVYLDPHFVSKRPQAKDVVGHYALTSQTVVPGGLAVLGSRRCDIELRSDGTFTATNLPPDQLGSPIPNFFNTLVTGSGKWRMDVVSHGGSFDEHWGIILDSSPVNVHPIHLAGWRPPYRLYLSLGDPDCGYTMILERTEQR